MKRDTVATLWWVMFLVFMAVVTAVVLYPRYQEKKHRNEELQRRREMLADKRKEHEKISKAVDDLENSPEAVEKTAREKFGMAKSGETILVYSAEKEK